MNHPHQTLQPVPVGPSPGHAPGPYMQGPARFTPSAHARAAAKVKKQVLRYHAMATPFRSSFETPLLFILAIIYIVYYNNASVDYNVWINSFGPGIMAIVLMFGAYRMLRDNPATMWAPLLWFRVSSAVYFGVGAIIPSFVNDATFDYLQFAGDLAAETTLKVNIINTLSIVTVLVTSSLFFSFINHDRKFFMRHAPGRDLTLFFAKVFLAVGSFIRYGIETPYAFGLVTFEIPGVLLNLGHIFYVGVYLLIFYGFQRKNRSAIVVAMVVMMLDLLVSALSFAKFGIIYLLIFSLMGYLSAQVSLKRIGLSAMLIAGTFFLFVPLVNHGRQELTDAGYVSQTGASISTRLDYVFSYFTKPEEIESGQQEIQSGLSRLTYVNIATAVVNLHDWGEPGNSLENAFVILIPRVLWPNKPIVSDVSSNLFTKITGQVGSSVSPGLFAEGYWNYGWLGIPFLMIPLGILLAYWSRFALRVIAMRNWLFLPILAMGVKLGLRTDGVFVIDVFGGTGIALITYMLLFFTNQIFITFSRENL